MIRTSTQRAGPVGRFAPAAVVAALLAGGAPPAGAAGHGIAMHGAPKYGADFTHFDYVNPDAPKGGVFRRALAGTFDSLNPFIIKGVRGYGRHLVFETLTRRAWTSRSPCTASSPSRSRCRTTAPRSPSCCARRRASTTGAPVTADDVVFSWETLKEHGRPQPPALLSPGSGASNGPTSARCGSSSMPNHRTVSSR